MPDIFDQLAAQQKQQTTLQGDVFDQLASGQQQQQNTAQPTTMDKVRGVLGTVDSWNPFSPTSDINKGIAKGALDTVNSVSSLVNKIPVVGETLAPSQGIAASEDLAKSENTAQSVGKVAEGIAEFMLGDEALKGLSVGERLGLTQKVAKLAQDSPYVAKLLEAGMNAVRQGTVGTGQGLLHGEDAGTAATQGAVIGATGGLLEAVPATVKAAIGTDAAPGLLKQVIKGSEVSEPIAENAVRGAVDKGVQAAGTGASTEGALVKNGRTIMDDHLSALYKNEKAAYKAVDDTVGFDLKAEKAQLSNDQYKLSQLGNTDADITQREKLIEAINDSTDRIAQAEKQLQAAGLDPKAADAIHQQRMAGTEFKKVLVRNTNPDGTLKVDSLANAVKNLRFSKYGDRLQQFLGSKDAADAFESALGQAQQVGAHAIKAQAVAKWIAKAAVGGTALYEGGQLLNSIRK